MLEYVLEVNELTAAPDDYLARTVNVPSHTQEDIVNRIMRIGAGLTRSDIAAVLEAEKQVIAEIVAEGGAVNTDLFNAFPSIQGVFHSAEDSVDGFHQKVRINLHAGTALRDAVSAVKTKKLPGVVSGTIISSVTDVKTGSQNHLLTPGRNIKIAGAKLKIAGEDPSVGLFFDPEAGGALVPVDMSDLAVNRPAELIAVIPNLAPGVYRVRIVTQYSGGTLLKHPHTLTFDKPLTVQQPGKP
jgi:hypothetical protein